MEPQSSGAEIIREAYELITGDRQAAYSHPADDYQRTVNIFNALMGRDILTSEEGVLFMVCMKLSRLMHELEADLDVPDNTRDAVGYLGCLHMIRQSNRQQAAKLDALRKRVRHLREVANGLDG